MTQTFEEAHRAFRIAYEVYKEDTENGDKWVAAEGAARNVHLALEEDGSLLAAIKLSEAIGSGSLTLMNATIRDVAPPPP